MATSFITKDKIHGFWIHDSLMQVACWGIVSVIDMNSLDSESWLKENLREHIFNNSQGIFVGFMHLELEEFLIKPERIQLFNEILDKTKSLFLSKGEGIPLHELNSFQKIQETAHRWISPLPTQRVVKVLTWLEDVVNDNILIKASDEIDYQF